MPTPIPPVLLELRAKATEVYATFDKVTAEEKKMAASSEVSAAKMQAASKKTEGSFKSMGAFPQIVGVAALAAGVASIKMAGDFQESTTQLVTGAGESEKNLKMVRQGLLDMAPAVGMGPDKLAKAMFLVESAGQHGADGLKVMQAAAEGAKIGGADATVVADGLTTAMTDYHLSADQAANTTSKLIATVAAGKSNMGALAGALSAVLPSAAAAGVGLDQVLGAMATMTGQGISAQQSAQDLSSVIASMGNPTSVQTKTMAQMGLTSIDVAANLGKKGLTGTMSELSTAIMAHMGPAGLVLQSSFNESKKAAESARTELSLLPKSLQGLGQKFLENKITQKEWAKEMKGQDVLTANLGKKFAASAKAASSFSDSLQAGKGSAATFNAIMADMTGGQSGLKTALALTGDNAKTFETNVNSVGKASKEAGGHVHGWALTQDDFKVKMAKAVAGVQVMAITVGDKLIPVVLAAVQGIKGFVDVLVKNPPLLIGLAVVIGGIVVTAIGLYVASLVMAGIETGKKFADMIASGAKWVAEHIAGFALAVARGAVWLATSIAQGAVWVATSAAQGAAWVAKNAAIIGQSAVLYARYYGPMIAQWVASNARAVASQITQGLSLVASQVAAGAKTAAVWVATSAKTVASFALSGAAMIAQKAVLIGSAVATGAATAAQWLFNAALDANPISIVIIAIAALVAGLVWFFTQTKLGQDIFKNVMSFITGAIGWVTEAFKNVVNWVTSNWPLLLSIIGGPIGAAVAFVITHIDQIRQGFSDVFGVIGGIVTGAFSTVQSIIRGVMNGVVDLINGAIGGLNTLIGLANNVPGVSVSTIGKLPHFDIGGPIPGSPGAPLAITAHGGEYMLSRDMLAGRASVPRAISDAIAPVGRNNAQTSAQTHTVNNNVTVNAQTNASPNKVATTVGWELKQLG